jgi:uncharacterized cysteine cluster protein YcgN (CxxCxxCC family)
MDTDTRPFWKTKSLQQMSAEEWEALCDGCGWCCMHKIEDEESGQVYTTHVACRLLNLKTCRCTNYPRRLELVDTCLKITPANVLELTWLPETCAYRRIALGEELPEWHPLITGDPKSTHRAGASVLGLAISEYGVDLEDLEDYIIESEEDS